MHDDVIFYCHALLLEMISMLASMVLYMGQTVPRVKCLVRVYIYTLISHKHAGTNIGVFR